LEETQQRARIAGASGESNEERGFLMAARKTATSAPAAAKKPTVRRRKVTEEMIREHAYFRSMTTVGSPLEHWLAAERELTKA
jgi:hypothetical protein